MKRNRSPHDVLGLARGADQAAIEAAYRALIKRYHPDRPGGDPAEARAVIHAYRALTRSKPKLPVLVEAPRVGGRRRRFTGGWVLLGLSVAALLALPWPELTSTLPLKPAVTTPHKQRSSEPSSPALVTRVSADLAAVEAGVSEAERIARQDQPGSLESYSRSCANDLQRLPGDSLLDHCLAFDVAASSHRPATGDWLQSAVMSARHEGAARRIVGDRVLAAERVRQVRGLVEQQLLQQPQ